MPFCRQCGVELDGEDNFCADCGKPSKRMKQDQSIKKMHSKSNPNQKIKNGGWNWWAFFFGPLWYLYKGMYLQGIIILVILFFLAVVSTWVNLLVYVFCNLSVYFFCGFRGNRDYYRYNVYKSVKAESKKKKQSTSNNEEMVKEIRKWAGGLIIIGIIQFAATFLSTVWGILLILIGIFSTIVQKRWMFLLFGFVILIAGLMNLASSLKPISIFWVVFGVLQLYWAMIELKKYKKYEVT